MRKKSSRVDIYKDIFEDNNRLAEKIRQDLHKEHITTFNILGSPGSGKTTFLISLIKSLGAESSLVIEGDVESDIDTQKLKGLGIAAYQINTHGACHLDAIMIDKALREIGRPGHRYMFIENIGNLICPTEYRLGEDKRILIASITEGSDKPYKYPRAFEIADLIVISKSDLIGMVDFDEDQFTKGVKLLNKTAPIMKVSSVKGAGVESVSEWVRTSVR